MDHNLWFSANYAEPDAEWDEPGACHASANERPDGDERARGNERGNDELFPDEPAHGPPRPDAKHTTDEFPSNATTAATATTAESKLPEATLSQPTRERPASQPTNRNVL